MKLSEYRAEEEDADSGEYEPVSFSPLPGDGAWKPVQEWGTREWTHWLAQHDGWDAARIAQYLEVDRYRYGVGFQRHVKEPFTYFYLPVPAAVPFHAIKKPNILYGGAVGGTKSHASRWDAYRHLFGIPNYTSLIMRRTHTELEQNHTSKAIGECQRVNDYFQKEVMDLTPSSHKLTIPHTGAVLNFGHCQNLGDEEKYLGPEYDDFRPEELATFEQQQIIGIQGRLRSTKTGPWGRVMCRIMATTNPGAARAKWIKDYWIDKIVRESPEYDNPLYNPEEWVFLQAKLYDNPYLMDPDGSYTSYVKRLFMHSPQRRKQLLNGDWNAITGQFFEEWNPNLHVGHVHIPPGCKIERWIDWGYDPNPGVCHWVACLPNGRLYVFAEWVFRKTIASKVAQRIADVTNKEILPKIGGGAYISRTLADPSMWGKDGHIGESYEETFRRNGVRMMQADNERVMGWGRFRHWLQRHPEGGAWLMYHPDCPYAIRTIPALVVDDGNPDDVDTDGEDHAADADRYGLMARPTPTRYVHTPAPTLPGAIKHLVDAEKVAYINRTFGQVS